MTKESEIILDKVYVNKVFNSNGEEIKKGDSKSSIIINVLISKEDEIKLNNALIANKRGK